MDVWWGRDGGGIESISVGRSQYAGYSGVAGHSSVALPQPQLRLAWPEAFGVGIWSPCGHVLWFGCTDRAVFEEVNDSDCRPGGLLMCLVGICRRFVSRLGPQFGSFGGGDGDHWNGNGIAIAIT